MNSDELTAIDDRSLPTWGEEPPHSDRAGSVVSWDTTEMDERVASVVYSDSGATFSLFDANQTKD